MRPWLTSNSGSEIADADEEMELAWLVDIALHEVRVSEVRLDAESTRSSRVCRDIVNVESTIQSTK